MIGFLSAWRMLWPSAVKTVNADEIEDRHFANVSSPVERLTAALVQAMPDLTADAKLLDPEPWATILGEIGNGGDEAGLQAILGC